VLLPQKFNASHIILAGVLLALTACGAPSQLTNPGTTTSGSFAGTTVTAASAAGVASVTLNPAKVTGGVSTQVTVHLTQVAPAGGAAVQLSNSDTSVVTTPATIKVAAGQTSATASASTKAVSAVTTVAISALYNDTVAGAALTIDPAASSSFTIAVQPSTLTIAPGKSASSKVTTKITTGYNHALKLTASSVPSGVSVTFTPSTIPAPGAGTSTAAVKVQSSVQPGTYSIRLTATGATAHSATLTLKVPTSSSGPGAKFQGCWYQQNGNKYQGALISVANPGTYPFNAVLYHGTTCDPNNFADQFGFGTDLNFGGFDTIFWFTDFHDQTDTSAIWEVGSDKSACVNYTVAPDCP
jgi:hypothetical protein